MNASDERSFLRLEVCSLVASGMALGHLSVPEKLQVAGERPRRGQAKLIEAGPRLSNMFRILLIAAAELAWAWSGLACSLIKSRAN